MTNAAHEIDAARDAAPRDAAPDGLAALAREIRGAAKADTAFGAPVREGATTIVPVAKARFGLGGGRRGQGSGAGGGMMVQPVGYIVIDAQGARYTSLLGPQIKHALVGLAVGLWLGRRTRRR